MRASSGRLGTRTRVAHAGPGGGDDGQVAAWNHRLVNLVHDRHLCGKKAVVVLDVLARGLVGLVGAGLVAELNQAAVHDRLAGIDRVHHRDVVVADGRELGPTRAV